MTVQPSIPDWQQRIESALNNMPEFNRAAVDAAEYIRAKLYATEASRDAADVLHGKGLGHPLHPILTDLTIGSWTYGVLFDVLAQVTGMKSLRKAADLLTLLGTASAIPTAITGMADFSAIKHDAAKYGAAHGMLNGLAFMCFATSTLMRLSGKRSAAMLFSFAGMGISTVSGWLGGHLVFHERVGVNHVMESDVKAWTAVMADADLPVGKLTRVEVDDVPVLLFRRGDQVHAIHAVCSHAGAPLEQGKIVNEWCVECPWHQSVFDLRDGHVVHAPSTYNQPRYETRIENGQIEVRSWRGEPEGAEAGRRSMYDADASQPEVIRDQESMDRDLFNVPSQAEGDDDER